jgi:hypothetical protein
MDRGELVQGADCIMVKKFLRVGAAGLEQLAELGLLLSGDARRFGRGRRVGRTRRLDRFFAAVEPAGELAGQVLAGLPDNGAAQRRAAGFRDDKDVVKVHVPYHVELVFEPVPLARRQADFPRDWETLDGTRGNCKKSSLIKSYRV